MNTMSEQSLNIESQIGLGFFRFGNYINKIISEIRDRGESFQKVDIVMGENPGDPVYLVLLNEGIKLRFDGIYQTLDLIEIDTKQNYPQRFFNIYYKNEILLGRENSPSHKLNDLSYNKINSIFGPSELPSSLDENKYIILKYEGISFLFLNNTLDSDEYIKFQNLYLSKIILFGEKNLKDSICPDDGIPNNTIFRNRKDLKNHLFNIKIEFDKGIILYNAFVDGDIINKLNTNYADNQIHNTNNNNLLNYASSIKENKAYSQNYNRPTKKDFDEEERETNNHNELKNLMNDNSIEYEEKSIIDNKIHNKTSKDSELKFPIIISFGDNLDSVLFKLKNPNFVFHKSKNIDNSEYENISLSAYNKDESDDFYLNYYSLGIDLLFDGATSKLKKIKLHTNNPFSTDFGIWNRAPFILELNKNIIRKFNETNYDYNSSSRKVSEDYNTINIRNSFNNNMSAQINNTISHSNNDENQVFKQNANFDSTKLQNPVNKSDLQMFENSSNFNSNNNHYNNNGSNNINSYTFPYNNFNLNNRRKRDYRSSFDNNEKSFNSINESYISLSSNLSENNNLVVSPNIFFSEVVSKLNKNSYVIYHRCETKLMMTIKYYCFDGLLFEVLENNTISSITIFKTCSPTI